MHFQKIKISTAAASVFLLILTALAPRSAAQANNADVSTAQSSTTVQEASGTSQTAAPPEPDAIKGQPLQGCSNSAPLCPEVEDTTYQAAFGFNYPGANIKMFLSGGFAAEIKGQYMDKIGVGGLRFYFYNGAPKKGDRLKFFGGVEFDAITFKGNLSKGAGIAVEAFAGLELFILKNVALQADVGPAYISVTDDATSLSSNGLAFVINSGINFYF